jgi:hypothetical protein
MTLNPASDHPRNMLSTRHNCTLSQVKRIPCLKYSRLACGMVLTSQVQPSKIQVPTKSVRVQIHLHRYTTMTRFFAHLCLFLQMIDTPVPPHATQIILEAYLQVLEVITTFFSSQISSHHHLRPQASVNSLPCTPVHLEITPSSVTPRS